MKRTKLTDFGALIALAFIFSYLESMIPLPIGIPGIKLGLANLVVVVALYLMGTKDAFVISIVRIILAGVTFGSLYSILYSLAGGFLSFLMMYASKKWNWFSITGTSILGAVFHNTGQLMVAALVLETAGLSWYLPFLLAAGVLTGIVIGLLASVIVPRIQKYKRNRDK